MRDRVFSPLTPHLSPLIIMKKTILALVLLASLSATAQTYTVQQLVDSALANNYATSSAQLGIEAAEQQRKEVFTKFFPMVSATGLWFNANQGMAKIEVDPKSFIPQEMQQTMAAYAQMLPPEIINALTPLASPVSMSMMKNGTIASVMAVQPVFMGGQIVNGFQLAKVGEEVSRLQLRLSENEVVRTTEQYFWQLASLQEKMNTIAVVEELLSSVNKDVSLAVQAGLTLRNDLLQVQLRQNEVESQKVRLQNGIALLRLTLAQYCGLKNTDYQLSYDAQQASALISRHDHQTALANTPEYQLLNQQVEAAKLQRRMEVGKNLPSVAVGAGYNYHNLMDRDHTFGMVFATVSVPISSWWGGSHAIKRRKLEQQRAEQQLEDNSELLRIRMQKAWNDVEEAYQQLEIADRSIEQATENLRLNRDYYRAGTCTMNDLLQAQLLYQQAMDKRTDAFADYQKRIIDYRQSLGM